jgi:hypothetical protein
VSLVSAPLAAWPAPPNFRLSFDLRPPTIFRVRVFFCCSWRAYKRENGRRAFRERETFLEIGMWTRLLHRFRAGDPPPNRKHTCCASSNFCLATSRCSIFQASWKLSANSAHKGKKSPGMYKRGR